MAFGCQMNDTVYLLFLHQFIESIEVADVHLDKLVVGFVLDVLEVSQITCVCELIEVDDVLLWVFVHEEAHYMASDEASTAGDDDISFHFVCCFKLLIHFSSESTQ